MKNRIWVYAPAYNEANFVKHFLFAYREAERIVIYDNMSTDNTVELLLQDPRVEVRQFNSNNEIRDDLYLEIKNNAWKEARGKAEWVIVVDFDEVFNRCVMEGGKPKFDLDLREMTKQGYNIIRPFGYNMIALDAPLGMDGHPFDYVQMATYHVPEEKMCCFNPNQISEIRFWMGCHTADPLDMGQTTKEIKIAIREDFKLLHFKFWNLTTYLPRMEEYQRRLSKWNKGMSAGWHYVNTIEWHRDCVVNGFNHAVPLFECKKPV
jgi:glycosyltransferase involved in cell wall biosynthesis